MADALDAARTAAQRLQWAEAVAHDARFTRDKAVLAALGAGHSPSSVAAAVDLSRSGVRKIKDSEGLLTEIAIRAAVQSGEGTVEEVARLSGRSEDDVRAIAEVDQ